MICQISISNYSKTCAYDPIVNIDPILFVPHTDSKIKFICEQTVLYLFEIMYCSTCTLYLSFDSSCLSRLLGANIREYDIESWTI